MSSLLSGCISSVKDIPHLGDVVLHQMFIEWVGDLQPTDEGGNDCILVTVVYQGHLVLDVVDVILQTLPRFRLDREEMIVLSLKFSPRRTDCRMSWSRHGSSRVNS